MSTLHIKICGLTRLDDAQAVIEAGADFIGYNFFPGSPRCISPESCAQIQAGLSNRGLSAIAVGVFVNPSQAEIDKILADCGLQLAQLSGDEPPDLLKALGPKAFKAIRPRTPEEAQAGADQFTRFAGQPALLVDAYRPGLYGGTGQIGNWDLARDLATDFPLLLAGGLHPGNAAQAVARVHPWGIDVASGVESSPGRKDPQKVSALIHSIRSLSKEAPL